MPPRVLAKATAALRLPTAITDLGADAARAFADFFTSRIRKPNTRAANGRNAGRFLGWLDAAGVSFRDHRAMHVAAYIEMLGRPAEAGAPGCRLRALSSTWPR